MKTRKTRSFILRVLCVFAVTWGLLFPLPVLASTGKAMTKAGYVRLLTQSQAKSPFTPPNAGALSEETLFQAVADLMKSKGITFLEGAKGGDPLTREEYINLTYAFMTGEKGNSTIENKFFLKEKKVIDPSDIGAIQSFEGGVKAFRAGSKEAIKITGAEPVLFQDIDETDEGSRIELMFDDLSVLTIGEEARIEINKMVYDPVKNTREVLIQQHVGKMRVKVSKIDAVQTNFTVKTPTAVIGVRGTEFVTDVGRDGKTSVVTISGLVGVRPSADAKEKGEKGKEGEKKGKGEKSGKEGQQTGEASEGTQEGEASEGESTATGSTETGGETEGGGEGGSESGGGTGSAPAGGEASTPGGETGGAVGSPDLGDTGGGEEIMVSANASVSISEGGGLGEVTQVSAEAMNTIVKDTTVQNPVVIQGGGTVTETEAARTVETVAEVVQGSGTEGQQTGETSEGTQEGEASEGESTATGSTETASTTGSTDAGQTAPTEGVMETSRPDLGNLTGGQDNLSGNEPQEETIDRGDQEINQQQIIEQTSDTDGDGVKDSEDAFPNDPNETRDSDGDGTGDNGDAFPNDRNETRDTDGDGTGDNSDAFPNDPNETRDSDGDGTGDNSDAFPNDRNETRDTDGDGTGDNADAFPNDPNETRDTDGDGIGDNSDPFPNDPNNTRDTDGDGVEDSSDAFPNDPNETKDTDGDGTGDNADAFDNDPNETADSDADGIGDNADLFPRVPHSKSGMASELRSRAPAQPIVVDPDAVSGMAKTNLDYIQNGSSAGDPVNRTMATAAQIRNKDFLPSRYAYGLQAGGNYMNPNTLSAIENDNFLAYATQVEEDYLNWAALQLYKDSANNLGAYYNSIGETTRRQDAYFLRDTILTKLENADIRERDAYLAQEADAKAGRVLKDAHGNWVRVQQYVLTPDDRSVEVLSINLRGSGAGDLSGLTYMDWKTVFSNSLGGVSLTSLPWGHWLTTQGNQVGGADPLRVMNPSSYSLRAMGVSFVGPKGGIFEGRVFNGIGADGFQRISQQELTINNVAAGLESNFNFNPSPANPTQDMTYYTALAGTGNPQGFKYVINDRGTAREINVNFFVLGNSTTAASEGAMSSGFGTIAYKDIWMALGTGTSSTMPSIGSHGKGFGDNGQIGNNLEIRFQDGTNSSLLGAPVDLIYIPLPNMEWKSGTW